MHALGALVTVGIASAIFVVMFTLTLNKRKIDDVLGVGPLQGRCGTRSGVAAGNFGSKAMGGLRLSQKEVFEGADLSIDRVGATPDREVNW